MRSGVLATGGIQSNEIMRKTTTRNRLFLQRCPWNRRGGLERHNSFILAAYLLPQYRLLLKITAVVQGCWSLFFTLKQTHWMASLLYIVFFISTEVVYLQRWHGCWHMKLLLSWHVLCTPYNHAPCHFMQSRICKVHACLAVICHLHFWQNECNLLRAPGVIEKVVLKTVKTLELFKFYVNEGPPWKGAIKIKVILKGRTLVVCGTSAAKIQMWPLPRYSCGWK